MIHELLWASALAMGLLVVLLAVGAIAHAVWVQLRLEPRARRIRRATGALTQLFLGGQDVARTVDAVGALPIRQQTELLGSLARAVSGEQRIMIRDVAARVGLTATGARWTRSANPTRRLRGVRIVANVGAGHDDLATLLADRSDQVRAEAVRLVVNDPTADGVLGLLRLLGDDHPGVAFAAKDALVRCGGATGVTLSGLDPDELDPRTLTDLLDVAVQVAHISLEPLADALLRHTDPVVRAGAIRLTAGIGATVATTTLVDLLDDDEVRVRAAAADGLGRLNHWPATPRLAARLADPAWDVRLAAGLALRRMGAPVGSTCVGRWATPTPSHATWPARSSTCPNSASRAER